ncbi:MAG: hypothetical protein ABSF26_30315 [Thermoguttaceae bacterium]|jgi:hypothetical protein
MRHWDLAGGVGRLELAVKALQLAAAEVSESWDDEANRRIVATYVAPAEPRIKTMLDAVRRVAEALDRAERQCRNE